MKVLFDANVIVSGFVSRGYSFEVIKDAVFRHKVYYTEHSLKEVQHILSTKFPLSEKATGLITNTIKRYSLKGESADVIKKLCRDEKDNQIMADALANEIEILITGDKDLLGLRNYQGIKIITPREYWKL